MIGIKHKPAILFAGAILGLTLRPGSSQSVLFFRGVIQIDCSAYRKQSDGSWEVLKPNIIMRGRDVAREVVLGDDPETAKLRDGSSLHRNLDAVCSHYQQR